MGVRVTQGNTGPYALYDSVTGLAFAEVFEDRQDAEDFVEWAEELTGSDLRVLGVVKLCELRVEWNRHAYDNQGERHAAP